MPGNNGVTYSTQSANVPSIQSSATALSANTARISWMIQNQGTNPLFILCGSGASTTVYHAVLPACSVAKDGTGGIAFESNGTIYDGIITVAGTNPSYTCYEVAP